MRSPKKNDQRRLFSFSLVIAALAVVIPGSLGAEVACESGGCDYYLAGTAYAGTCKEYDGDKCGCWYNGSGQKQSACNKGGEVEIE